MTRTISPLSIDRSMANRRNKTLKPWRESREKATSAEPSCEDPHQGSPSCYFLVTGCGLQAALAHPGRLAADCSSAALYCQTTSISIPNEADAGPRRGHFVFKCSYKNPRAPRPPLENSRRFSTQGVLKSEQKWRRQVVPKGIWN